MVLLFLVGAYSIGGFFDPVTHGISFRVGQSTGLRAHLVGAFAEGEREVRTWYWHSEWKPFHWLNAELRLEYSLPTKGWFYPYIGVGIAYRDAVEWISYYKYERDTTYWVLEEKKENYQSAVVGFGVEFKYFAELAKGVPLIENISFLLEFPVIYYKFKYELTDPDGYDYYHRSKRRSGIGGGLGIYYNFK